MAAETRYATGGLGAGMRTESKEDIVVERAGASSRGAAAHEFDLFVVHAAADGEFVHGFLLPALNLPPARVLLVDKLTPGPPIVAEIERGVSRSRFTVAVLSPAYLADRWAVFGAQLASYVSVADVHVIPLRLTDGKLPIDLEFRVALDFTDRARWEPAVARLRELLQTTAPAPEQIACPYPGMRPFTTSEANRFFGRDKELDDLVGRLDHGEREIYVIGPSGSGKSSLVQAGLLHALDAGSSRLGRSFCVCAMRPGERPTDRLTKALEGDLATPAATVSALVARHSPAERVLVFVDQFEEVFTLADAVERQRFLTTLRAFRDEVRCYLLLALRADFFGAFMDSTLWPDLAGRISRLEIAPLRGPALAQAITAPEVRVGVQLEARLCDRLVADAADEPGALSHVQETLRLLWEQRRQRLLGLAEYDALGDGGSGLHIAIARHADATMRALTVAQQAIARRVLLRLVSFGEGRADTRRQQKVQALRSAADDEAEFARVLQQLTDDRLVTVDGAEGDDDALVDLSHEALITAWPALREWVAQKRVGEQRRRWLDAKVGEWSERGRGMTGLLDLVELSEAEHWMQSDAARELGYRAELGEFVTASRNEIERVERQRRRRMFLTIAVLATFSVVVSILGIVAWRQQQEARRFVAVIYMKQGEILLEEGHPMKALLYFVEARSQGVESVRLRKLFAQASNNMPRVTFAGHKASVVKASFTTDDKYVVTASYDKTAAVWDTSTGHPTTPPLEHQNGVTTAAFSFDGRRVVTTSLDNTVRVWDAWTGKPVTPPLEHHSVMAAAFSADGTRVVTASSDRTARVWDAWTGKPVTPPLEHESDVRIVAFSRDGLRVATASSDDVVRIWDAWRGELVGSPFKHHGAVIAVAFSPDGPRVVTVGEDHQTAQIWDASTDKLVAGPLEHQDDVTAAAFNSDGKLVITTSSDKMARIWDASRVAPLARSLSQDDLLPDPDGVSGDTRSDGPIDMGTLEDWRLLARCCPFVLVHNVPMANLDPLRVCPQH